MGYQKDLTIQKLDIASLNSLVRATRDGGFRRRAFEQINLDPAPLDEDDTIGLDQNAGAETPAPEPQIDIEALRAQAHKTGFTEGFAQGYQQGQAEAPPADLPDQSDAQVQLDEARRMFTDLTRALVDRSEAHHTSLRVSMEQALIALASELAGQQIDALPQAFAKKVEDLVNRVGKSVEGTQIFLNPEDLAVIHPVLNTTDSLRDCKIEADESLSRGAVDIRSGPNRVQSALPEPTDASIPADWEDENLNIETAAAAATDTPE